MSDYKAVLEKIASELDDQAETEQHQRSTGQPTDAIAYSRCSSYARISSIVAEALGVGQAVWH
jgi:hypothetical protein